MNSLLTYLQRALGPPVGRDAADGQLLARFAEQGDEAAFEALVRQHGPLVLGVCRRLLRHEQDAEDAFQATFLVLASKAAAVGQRQLIGPWLQAVAYRVARKMRAGIARRTAHEKQASALPAAEPASETAGPGLSTLFDEEVTRLPQKYRLPLVLCYLEGKTKAEAARQLGWPEGTVSGRLARAREMLRTRLVRQGIALPAGAVVAALTPSTLSAAVPATLTSATTRAAVLFAAGAAAESLVSASATALAKGAMRSMFVKKVTAALAVLFVVSLAGIAGVGTFLRLAAEPARPAPQAGENEARSAPQGPAQPKVELKLYAAGAGAPKPGVHAVSPQATYREVLQAAGVDLEKVRGQGLVAYLVQLWPEGTATPVGVSGELTKMLNEKNETSAVVADWLPKDPKAPPPRLILWVGTADHWNLLEKSSRRAAVISGANAEQRAAELRKQGVPAKAVTSPDQGWWPLHYDELMSLAEKAPGLKKWPGGESWLAGAEDEAAVRKTVKDFVEAAIKGDAAALSRLHPGKSPEGVKAGIAELRQLIAGNGTPAEVRSVTLAGDRALVVTDFFAFRDGKRPARMSCCVYDLRRQQGVWGIRDLDVEDVEGLIEEVRRFDRDTRPRNPE